MSWWNRKSIFQDLRSDVVWLNGKIPENRLKWIETQTDKLMFYNLLFNPQWGLWTIEVTSEENGGGKSTKYPDHRHINVIWNVWGLRCSLRKNTSTFLTTGKFVCKKQREKIKERSWDQVDTLAGTEVTLRNAGTYLTIHKLHIPEDCFFTAKVST